MKKFNIQDKLEAIKMYQEGIRSKEIFSKLFPEVNTSKYQRDYTSKTISLWRRTQGKGLKIDKFRKVQKKLKALEMEVAILKKESVLFPLLRKELKLKRNKGRRFEIIYEVKKENSNFPLKTLLEFYSLSNSGYYKYTSGKEKREEKDFNLFLQVNEIFQNSKQTKGYRQISMDLHKNHKQVYRIMFKYGLKSKIRNINKSRVSLQKNLKNQEVGNVLNRQFKQKTPYSFTSTDITHLKHQKQVLISLCG